MGRADDSTTVHAVRECPTCGGPCAGHGIVTNVGVSRATKRDAIVGELMAIIYTADAAMTHIENAESGDNPDGYPLALQSIAALNQIAKRLAAITEDLA